MSALAVDHAQLGRFVEALFMHAGEGGIVSLRAFYDDDLARKRNDPPYKIRNVRLNGGGLEPVIAAVARLAEEALASGRPVVVAPPIATFRGGKADEKGLLEGLTLSVELDEHAAQALAFLRNVLGPPTFVVESGGEWANPDTGEVEPKLHVHWRLSEPTQTPDEHARLKRARALACELVGADATSKPAVHPMRWAGTVHRKNPDAPRACRIVEENPAEIALEHALDELEGLGALRGWSAEEGTATPGTDPAADDGLLAAVAERLTNPLPPKAAGSDGEDGKPRGGWADWNRVGLAFYRASGGSEAGFKAFDAFSAKNKEKYDPVATRARWEHYPTSPPTSIGAGTLVYEARRINPAFRSRKPEMPETTEAPREQATDAASEEGWSRRLLQGDDGPIGCEANVEIALRHAPELAGRLRFNELTCAAECEDPPWSPGKGWRPWTDNDDTALAIFCQHAGIRVRPAAAAAAVQLVAADSKCHPVREYLDRQRWRKTPRLDTWLHAYLGVGVEKVPAGASKEDREAAEAKNTYVRQVGRKWLISAVARAYEPGCKADHALILEGPQRAGKSSALAALMPDPAWFADSIADLGTKDSAQDLAGKWLIELSELDAMRRGEVARTKAFMSRARDHYRPSYGRRSQDFPRQGIFGGTTNADAYLADSTGNRRFWGVKVGTIKLDELRRDRDQLWAEAVAAYRAGEKWWLTEEVEKAAAVQQAERRIVDPWEERVLQCAAGKAEMGVDDALAALSVPLERRDQGTANRVARILKADGWERTQRREGGTRVWVYRRPAAQDPAPPDPASPVSPVDGIPTGDAFPSNYAGVTSVTSIFPKPNARGVNSNAGADGRDPPIEFGENTGDTGDTGDSQAGRGFPVTSRSRATGDSTGHTGDTPLHSAADDLDEGYL